LTSLIIELNKRYRLPKTLTEENNTPQCTIYWLKPDKLTTCLEIGGVYIPLIHFSITVYNWKSYKNCLPFERPGFL